MPLKELQKRYPNLSKTTIHTHAKKKIGIPTKDRRKENKGRPRKLTERDVRSLESNLHKLRENVGDVFSTDVQRESKIDSVSNRTVRRCLREKGYKYSQCRKKGQLTKEDLVKRLKFARRCSKIPEKMWTEGISFYLDGTGWVHKTNPARNARTSRTRTWKKESESLSRNCTAKGKKEGVGGRMARFMVAIAYGKGVVACHQYQGHIDGEKFSKMVTNLFPEIFKNSANPVRQLFLQDGDPSQNSRLARDTWEGLGYSMFAIPPRSPDLNPIENVFHLIGKKLKKDAIDRKLDSETYEQFCARARRTVLNFDRDIIDKTISSMPKRIRLVIKGKGLRTKY
jgi:transposase